MAERMITRTTLFSFLLLLLPSVSDAAETSMTKGGSLAGVDAWNFKIERVFECPPSTDYPIIYSAPTFSRDFRRVIYVVGEPFDRFLITTYVHWFLIVRSLETTEVIKRVPFGDTFKTMADNASVAYSPDEKRVVVGPVTLANDKRGFVFVDIESAKIVPVPVEFGEQVDRLTWPENAYVTFNSGSSLNLDTLKVFSFSSEKYTTLVKPLEFRVSSNPKCSVKIVRSPHPGYADDFGPNDLVIEGRGYAKVLASSKLLGQNAGVIWFPDFRYILYKSWQRVRLDDVRPLVLITLARQAMPDLEFTIGRLNEFGNEAQQREMRQAFSSGTRIWGNVYGRKVNPLNSRLLGPETGSSLLCVAGA